MKTSRKALVALDRVTDKEYVFDQKGENIYLYGADEKEIKIETTEDGFTLMSVNGVSYPIEIVAHHQNEYELLVNGVTYNFSAETPFSLQRLKMLKEQTSESTTIRLKAPMPGKILEVLVKTGDVVKAGDTLVVLEAMKMQNAILASTKGVIKKVLVKEGDTTSKSDLLIELEKD